MQELRNVSAEERPAMGAKLTKQNKLRRILNAKKNEGNRLNLTQN